MKKILITDDIMNKFFDPMNQKSLNELVYEKYEGEINDNRKENDILANVSPVKMAAMSVGIGKGSLMKDFTAQGVGEWLLPAYIDERIREEIGDTKLLSYLVEGSTPVNSMSVVVPHLNLFSDADNKDAARMKRVSEGADIPIAEIKLGESAISLFKYGRAVQATYEAIAFMRVDLFNKTLQAIAADVSDQQSERAIKVLVDGDGNQNAIKTVSTAATGTFTRDDLISFALEFQTRSKVPMTTILAGKDEFVALSKMLYPTDEANGVSGNFSFNMPQLSGQNVALLYSDKVPKIGNKAAIIGLNKSLALNKYVAPQLSIREMSNNIRNQTRLSTITEMSGFAKYNNDAALALVSK